MSTKENKELMSQAFKEWGAFRGDVAKVGPWYEKYCAPGFIIHDLSRGDLNREQRIEAMVTLVSAFPDLNMPIDDMVAEGDKVVIRYTLQGTHKGTYMRIPATGKQIVVKGVIICKLVGVKCLEAWDFPDLLGVMTQLGVVPGAAPKK